MPARSAFEMCGVKKYVGLVLSTLFLGACATIPREEPPKWVEYFNSSNATAYVDLKVKPWDVAIEGLKTSLILINYPNPDAQGTHSAVMTFVLDCKNEMVKIENFTTYTSLDGQGDVIKKDDAPEEGFLPLDSFLNGDKIFTLICK